MVVWTLETGDVGCVICCGRVQRENVSTGLLTWQNIGERRGSHGKCTYSGKMLTHRRRLKLKYF